ncbi:RNA dependent RNA polymerase-domain-containing protein [Mycena capillaripes]|nr:RNA dependent RNA polymerase-domain-containing protein [Mycena capillaripes]
MSQTPSEGSFDGDDYTDFDWEQVDSILASQATQPSSPTKEWRSPTIFSPSTPSNERIGLSSLYDKSPATPSRPPRAGPSGSTLTLSRGVEGVRIEDEDDELPLPKRLVFGSKQDFDRNIDGESDEEVEEMLQERSGSGSRSSSMGPPPNPRPIQPSSTQSSFESTSSSNSLFSALSRTSSMSSMASMNSGRTSPLKRGAEVQHVLSPSPSKSRKLCQTQTAGSQSGPLTRAPVLERLYSTNMSSPQQSPIFGMTETGSSFSLSALFVGHHGSELEKYEIAHNKDVQKQFDNYGVHLGIQWELARGVSTGKWTWEDIAAKINAKYNIFRGTNSQIAWKVPDIMRGRQPLDSHDLPLWNEVDREFKAFTEGKSRGLGLFKMDEPWEFWDGRSSYYGGQIEYPLCLVKSKNPEQLYEIYLEKPEKGRSHRFARDLGSPSILHLSIPSKLVRDEGEDIRKFLAKRFIINGRVYLPIPPKDTTSVYLIQTNQDYERKPSPYYGDQFRISFDEFVQRHNPLELNSHQPFAKYTARFALGLSTSVPVLEFQKENIFYLPDILAEGWDATLKPPTEKIMTDGCGWINRSALLLITKRFGYDILPTAVQGRIGGAKGLWALHPSDQDNEPKIWIRPSQPKIHLRGDLRVHRIFDLLKASRPSQTETRERLSEQSILCLSSNGIPDDMLVSLLVKGLEQTVKPLLNWAPDAMPSLWRIINGAGNVSGSRLQRIVGSKSRILGFRDWDPDESDGEAEMDVDSETTSNRSGRDKGGGPLSLHEQAMELIQAGFHPSTSAYLNGKLRYIIKTEINSVVDKYKIALPESTVSKAFVIPDPLGVLKENEIYYRSSNPMKNPLTETLFQVLTGPIILGRYPIRLPCDMQKVTAVNVPELYNWPDVIIASTAGQQSLLSLLSGGDYDGDTVVFIWLEEFCKNFSNQPFTPPPEGFMVNNFEREVKTVEEVGNQLSRESLGDSQRTFQEYLLMGLCDSQVGLYSYFHDNAIWRHGYNHASSILMAYIGNTLLDAGKTGLHLKSEVFEEHQKIFGHTRPRANNWIGPVRDSSNPFILQTLSVAGRAKGDELLREHDLASGKLPESYKEMEKDADLLKPHKAATKKSQIAAEWSKLYRSELEAIERRIKDIYEEYRKVYALDADQKAKRGPIVLSAQEKFVEPIPNIQLMDAEVVEQVKASYAYSLSTSEEFGFTVAFNTLCNMKARAAGGIAPNCRVFDELKTISASASRATMVDDL